LFLAPPSWRRQRNFERESGGSQAEPSAEFDCCFTLKAPWCRDQPREFRAIDAQSHIAEARPPERGERTLAAREFRAIDAQSHIAEARSPERGERTLAAREFRAIDARSHIAEARPPERGERTLAAREFRAIVQKSLFVGVDNAVCG